MYWASTRLGSANSSKSGRGFLAQAALRLAAVVFGEVVRRKEGSLFIVMLLIRCGSSAQFVLPTSAVISRHSEAVGSVVVAILRGRRKINLGWWITISLPEKRELVDCSEQSLGAFGRPQQASLMVGRGGCRDNRRRFG